ncbi:MAG: alpha/beta fold hydrolase, partial [Propionibacteriaceae bacterium]|nr:alpha/beta fold hydrolase [Propionibacteriaceae bacterium]
YLTVIPEFSFDLAVTDAGRASVLIERYGQDRPVVLAGHSLGGAMAAQYAADHPGNLAGLMLLAAYPGEAADLSSSGLPVLSLTGEHDQVVNTDALETSRARLPADTTRMVIAGGVHSFFGRYGPQAGDGIPTVARAVAEQQIVAGIEGFLGGLSKP